MLRAHKHKLRVPFLFRSWPRSRADPVDAAAAACGELLRWVLPQLRRALRPLLASPSASVRGAALKALVPITIASAQAVGEWPGRASWAHPGVKGAPALSAHRPNSPAPNDPGASGGRDPSAAICGPRCAGAAPEEGPDDEAPGQRAPAGLSSRRLVQASLGLPGAAPSALLTRLYGSLALHMHFT